MSLIRRVCLFSSLVLVVGCGSPDPLSNPGTPPPHGGNIVKLSDGQGFVEVVHKPAASKQGNVDDEVTFYFLKTMETPLAPAPTKGTLDVRKKKKVTLVSKGETLVTPSGPPLFAGREVDGELTVELDGKSTRIPLGVR